ncbi:hypothetical protein QL285_064005 [Trifolium repens]|nr:hypothetical protein QL285_064005 [Trifolium repens]
MMGLLYWSNKQRNTYTPTKSHKICLHIGLLEEMEAKDQKLKGGSTLESKDQKFQQFVNIKIRCMLINYSGACFVFS